MLESKRGLSAAERFGGHPAAKDGRDRLLDRAIDLFYTRGFHAVGLDAVLAEAGVTKTTFYKHFESKEDLVLAAVQRRDEWEHAAWVRAVQQAAGGDDADPRKLLLATFDVLDVWFNDPTFHGCIFINAAVEFADPRDPVHRLAAQHKRRARDEWRDLAKAGGAADAETFADRFTTLVEGTLIMRHVHGRNDAARVARPMGEQLVQQFLPAPAAS